ncbi:PREDICTED: uncharacterized protein LOC104811316 [Tarenaya hassleriana]|uniref:uncharacterized protein LOC104811316 n=1 Tax=Tarenaya hassleriana TaxID=28532 RepID=UPI0008FD54ED|nr:PREDICTED: uncharacterized protein LOC104811316 [Tarenaya hassleriana]
MKIFLGFVILSVLSNGIHVEGSAEIDVMLKRLNKPAVKTIKSEDGDIIDCVDIYKQLAFDHPALKNHKIQKKSSAKLNSDQPGSIKLNSSKTIMPQTWRKAGECPEGTIPVRRVRLEEITSASNASQFGRKAPYYNRLLDIAHRNPTNFSLLGDAFKSSSSQERSEAFLTAVGYNYIGSQSDINVWNPKIESGDFSSGQIWMQNGPGDAFESVEAGWVVNQGIFGDSRTRLFAYWTKDGYKTTGCFNLLCSGFVQTSAKIALGAPVEPISSGDNQYDITIGLFKDANNGDWSLHLGDEVVGYWPGSLFSYLGHSAILVKWGGGVYSRNVKKSPHTKTQMGSGYWASGLKTNSAYHTNIRIKDYSLAIKYPENLSEFADEYDCYSTKLYRDNYMAEPFFYFGGPGQNPRCP